MDNGLTLYTSTSASYPTPTLTPIATIILTSISTLIHMSPPNKKNHYILESHFTKLEGCDPNDQQAKLTILVRCNINTINMVKKSPLGRTMQEESN